jgi:hypothetical protein
MWYIDGLLSRHQLFLTQEYVDLQQFHSLRRLAEEEPVLSLSASNAIFYVSVSAWLEEATICIAPSPQPLQHLLALK